MGIMKFNEWQFINAPLKCLPFRTLNQEINKLNGRNQSGYASALTPYLSNKVGFAYYGSLSASSGARYRGSVTQFPVDSFGQYAQQRFNNIVGGVAPVYGVINPSVIEKVVTPTPFRDIVVYFKTALVKDLYPPETYKYLQPILFNKQANLNVAVGASYPQANSSLQVLLDGEYTRGDEGGGQSWTCKADEINLPNLDNWLVITDMRFFDVPVSGEFPRAQVGVNSGSPMYNDYTFAACYTEGKVQSGTNDAYKTINTPSADGIISLNPVTGSTNSTSAASNYFAMLVGAPIYSARCEWILGQDNTTDWVSSFTKNFPNLNGEYITILAANRNDSTVKIEGKNTASAFFDHTRRRLVHVGANEAPHAYLNITDLYFNDNKSKQVRLVFNGKQSIINFFADWGLAATDDENKAKTMDSGLLLEGFVPDGGNTLGFDTNTTPEIPSNPDNTSDVIERTAPQISALSATNLYALTITQCKELFDFLMTDNFTKNISELFSDKLSAVNGLKLFPFDIQQHDPLHTVSQSALNVGNVQADISNSVLIDNYNTWVFGGSITQLAYYGNYNDYLNASYAIYIPFCGIVSLTADRVVNCKLELYYAVDLLTGSGTAVLYSNGVLFKTAPAQLGVDIPITFTNANQQAINATLSALNIASSLGGNIAQSVATGSAVPAVTGVLNSGISAFGAIANNQTKTGTIGGIGSNTGYTLPQTPFLIITRNKIAIPSDYLTLVGKPNVFKGAIGAYIGSGFVSVKSVKLETSATDRERNEIISLLANGIFV